MLCRFLAVIAVVTGATLVPAGAQLGDMPGPPGETPPMPPAQCKDLLALRDEWQKHGAAITAATKRKSDAKAACQLLRTYIATEAKMLKVLDENGKSCGVPLHVNQQVRASHVRWLEIGKKVCDAAARQPFHYDVPPKDGIDGDELRTFKLHPDRRPEPWPARRS